MPRNNNYPGNGQRAIANGRVSKRPAPRKKAIALVRAFESVKTRNTPLTCPMCPICMSHIHHYEVVSTVCGHIFCRTCLQQALKRNKHCPQCRRALSGSNYSYHHIFLSDNDDVDIKCQPNKEQTSQE